MEQRYPNEPESMWTPSWPRRPNKWHIVDVAPWNITEEQREYLRLRWRWCYENFGEFGKTWLYSPSQGSARYQFYFKSKKQLAIFLLTWGQYG